MRKRFSLITLMSILILAAIPVAGLRAQGQNPVTLTVAVTDFMRDLFDQRLIADFEASHPGIKLNVVSSSIDDTIPFAVSGTSAYFQAMEKLSNAADVIYVDVTRLNSPLATQAGYFLDLAPLVASDSTLNTDDFVPSIWRSYQWDKGIWAFPFAASSYILAYDPAAFDKAGLAYPNAKWTIDDLANAARTLGEKDATGKVTKPGLVTFKEASVFLFVSLLGDTLVDNSTIPNTPRLDSPALETILDTWNKLDQEGWIGTDFNNAPLLIVPADFLIAQNGRSLSGTLLPGGKAGLDVQGFAVSAGTQHPQEAYELAKYLSIQGALSFRFFGASLQKTPPAQPSDGVKITGPKISPEVQKLSEDALANGLTMTDLRYMDFVLNALDAMKQSGTDAKSALQAAQVDAAKAQQAAVAQKDTLALVVATPVPRATANPGKITLNFGLTSFVFPMPNRDLWDKVLADFAANDPEVGKVNLNTGPGARTSQSSSADQNDCFYLPYNNVPNADLTQLLSLDPLLSADTSFDKNDMLGNVMAQVQRDNKTWAMPMSIEPDLLRYDSDAFAKANVPEPTSGWTMDQFVDALHALKPDPNDSAPFVPRGIGGTAQYLLTLIAANGAIPLDYRTNPATINFTDPASVQAIQQVLDLAKQGYIKYDKKLATPPFKPIMVVVAGAEAHDLIYTDILNAAGLRRPEDTSVYKLTTYPHGSKYAALSYNLSTAYISAHAQSPEACYRLIKTLAAHPELFQAMPVRHSQISNPAMAAAQGTDLSALYAQFDALLNDPNTVTLPSGFAGGGAARLALEYWLLKAFDSYVLDGADLTAALTDAQTMARGFQECIAANPPNPDNQDQPVDTFKTCAEKVDPSLKE